MMVREVRFRGKKLYGSDKGSWVYATLGSDSIHYGMGQVYFNNVAVESLSIGQWTGMYDFEGADVYEGDVMHKDSHWGWYVAFEDGGFRRIPCSSVQRLNWEHYNIEQSHMEDWTVVGNIHDNPELLED